MFDGHVSLMMVGRGGPRKPYANEVKVGIVYGNGNFASVGVVEGGGCLGCRS